MRRPVFRSLFLASGLLALTQLMTPTDAAAEARLALVIGQSAYRTVPELPNAANDAKGMAELLGNAGFSDGAAGKATNGKRATRTSSTSKTCSCSSSAWRPAARKLMPVGR